MVGMDVAIGRMIINAQKMLAPGVLAFSALMGSYNFFDNGSLLEIIRKKATKVSYLFAAQDLLICVLLYHAMVQNDKQS